MVKFATDADILAALKEPVSLAYSATKLDTSLTRCREVLGRHKTEVITHRLEKAGQTVEQIAYQLDLIEHIDNLRKWIKNRKPT